MRGWPVLLVMMPLHALGGEPEDGLWSPWMAAALDAGCLRRDEVTLFLQAGEPVRAQTIVRSLGPFRGEQVVRCLLLLPAWQDHIRLLDRSVQRASSLVFRLDGRPPESQEGPLAWGASIRGRFRATEGLGARIQHASRTDDPPAGGLRLDGKVHQVCLGTLSPRVGQGVSLWSAGAFDDLGGVAGSHRLPTGVVLSAFRQRGHIDGLGWSRTEQETARGIRWGVVGRLWQGTGWTAAIGGGRLPGWLVRIVQTADGAWRWLAGAHGGVKHTGWSGRWGLAVFPEGWSGRGSLLKSWTPQCEAHVVVSRDHPDHPGWHSGEWRATRPDGAALPAWTLTAGIEWKGEWSGWWRHRWRSALSPVALPDSRSTLRLQRGGHRLTAHVELDLDGELAETLEWSARYRREWRPASRQVWRVHAGAGGKGRTHGGLVGVVAAFETRGRGRWRWGCAQAWGHSEAPARYIMGWDRLPARALRGGEAHAFIRHRPSGGRTEWALRFSWQDPEGSGWEPGSRKTGIAGFSVDFRPGTGRRDRSGRRYIGRAERKAVLPPPNQPKDDHGHHFRHQEWTLHPPPGGIVPGH